MRLRSRSATERRTSNKPLRRRNPAPPPRGREGYSWPRLVLASFLGVRLPQQHGATSSPKPEKLPAKAETQSRVPEVKALPIRGTEPASRRPQAEGKASAGSAVYGKWHSPAWTADVTRRYEIEPVPELVSGAVSDPTEIVDIHIPSDSPLLQAARPPMDIVLIQRRRMALLYGLTALLLVVVGTLAFGLISDQSHELLAAQPTSTAASSVQPSATYSGPASVGAIVSDDSSVTSTDATAVSEPSSGFTPPFGTEYLPSPVDGDGNVSVQEDVHISDIDYANSTTFYCPTSGLIDWNVAGYGTFSAQYGIPDNAQDATGVTNKITFTDQNGRTLDVATTSIGQPVKISFSVSGVDRLVMSCARQGSNDSTNNLVALGNAQLSTY